jgi:hypothetical protein
MPVIVEPPDGGEREVMIVRDHVNTAYLLARGYRFPRVDDVWQAVAELDEIEILHGIGRAGDGAVLT